MITKKGVSINNEKQEGFSGKEKKPANSLFAGFYRLCG
jgi:hypothetical protein